MNRGAAYVDETQSRCTNKFWWDVLEAWTNFISQLVPKSASDIMGICIWNNKANRNRSNYLRILIWMGNTYIVYQPMLSLKKMHWLQIRIIHRIIATNDLLLKMKLRQSNLCYFLQFRT